MAPVPFDTQKFVETLTASGLPDSQAKAISSAFREAIEAEFATKSDLRELELAIKSEIRELRDELRGDVHNLKSDVHELKSDVQELKSDVQELKSDVRELKSDVHELKSDMHKLELRMTIKLGAMQAVGIGVLAAILKLW